ncbi:MAG: pyridoxamine 5'-phosphate oxidase family protein [Pseudomonadota bacterium]
MSTKKEISAQELEKEISAFLMDRATHSGGKHNKPGCNLKHGYACVLATCHDNIPRATPVDFFCDGSMTIWINAEPGGKIANIMRNPQVSVGIYERVDHSVEQKSMQLWGAAEIINLKNSPEVFNQKLEAFGLHEAMAGMIEKMIQRGALPEGAQNQTLEQIRKQLNIIKIKPEKILLLHMRPDGPPVKKIWENGKASMMVGGI